MQEARIDRHGYNGNSSGTRDTEEENQRREIQLLVKVKALKCMTKDIGNAVREQTDSLNSIANDFDNTEGFLKRIMKRGQSVSPTGHNNSPSTS